MKIVITDETQSGDLGATFTDGNYVDAVMALTTTLVTVLNDPETGMPYSLRKELVAACTNTINDNFDLTEEKVWKRH